MLNILYNKKYLTAIGMVLFSLIVFTLLLNSSLDDSGEKPRNQLARHLDILKISLIFEDKTIVKIKGNKKLLKELAFLRKINSIPNSSTSQEKCYPNIQIEYQRNISELITFFANEIGGECNFAKTSLSSHIVDGKKIFSIISNDYQHSTN